MSKLILAAAISVTSGVVAWLYIVGGVSQLSQTPYVGHSVASGGETTNLRDASQSGRELIRGIGYIEPVSEVRRLVFKVDGVIGRLAVEVGQEIRKGDVLAVLIDHDDAAAVAEAEQQVVLAAAQREQLLAGMHVEQVNAARRNVEIMEERLQFATKQQARILALTARGVTTDAERDQTATEVQQARKSLEQAKAELALLERHVRAVDRDVADAEVRLAEARVETARQRLANTIMLSPLDGIVLEVFKREGEGARVLDRDPVMIVADKSRLRVRAEIDERFVHRLAAGQSARLYGRGLGDVRYPGTVSLVKRLMGKKTVFNNEASERKDLDVLQVLIDLPDDFQAPFGLQVDVDIMIAADSGQADSDD
ncbi:MAG: HlyD family efflux transporter periplasmic adaptor subunit [Pirellulales bacterium]|nr:HlyD family efflux transporter periplasmic adaptor subunit [Pirellulales bacterium]